MRVLGVLIEGYMLSILRQLSANVLLSAGSQQAPVVLMGTCSA